MSGGWIKMRTNLWTHPKVVRISSAIDRTRVHTIGALHGLWSVADQHADENGVIEMSSDALDSLVETPGMCAAMKKVGWLAVDGESLQFVGYQEHNGSTAKRRAEDQKRKKVSRKRPQKSGQTSKKPVTRGEEIRKENKPPKSPKGGVGSFDPMSVPIPESLDRQSFRESWSEWIAYRQGRRKPLSEAATNKQLKQLAECGVANAIAAIDDSIANDWQGLFPKPDEQKKARSRCPTDEDLANITVADFYKVD